MAEKINANSLKAINSREDLSSKAKSTLIINKKIVESSTNRIVESKQKSVTTGSKATNKTTSTTKVVTKTKTVRAKTEKKVYTLPGQKYDIPEEREPLRIFYESLSKQIPSSEMAEFWMMEHGLLSLERAKKAYEKRKRKQQELRTGTPVKSIKMEKPESSKKQQPSKNGDIKPKKRIEYSDDDDEDFIFKRMKAKG